MAGRASNELSNYFAIGKQTAKDVEATSFNFLKHLNGTGFDLQEDIQTEREGGDGQLAGLRYKASVKSPGQFVIKSRPNISGIAAAGILGRDSASIVASGTLNFHRQDFVGSAMPYYTVEQRYADTIERQANVKFTELDVTGEAGKPLEIQVSFVSGGSLYQRDIASSLTAVRESAPPHYYPGGSYTAVIGGTQALKVTKFKATLKRNVDDSVQTNALNTEDVIEQNAEFDLDATIKYEDRYAWNQIHYGGGSTVPVDLATGSFDAYTNTGVNSSFSWRMNFPLLQWTDAKVNRLDPDGKTMYLDISGMTIGSATTPVFFEQTVGAAASAAY